MTESKAVLLAKDIIRKTEKVSSEPGSWEQRLVRLRDANIVAKEVIRTNDALVQAREAVDAIMHELGVPQPDYPAPVTNAYRICEKILGVIEEAIK